MKIVVKNNEKSFGLKEEELFEMARKTNNKSKQLYQTESPKQLEIVVKDEIRFESIENFDISALSTVKVLESENGVIVKYSTKSNAKSPSDYIIRLNSKEYLVIETGEIKQYDNNEFKSREAINKSMSRLNDTIYLNYNENTNCVLLTLTMNKANATKDLSKFKQSVENLCRRLRYRYKKQYDLAYVIKFEQQMNENWHAHLLIKDATNKEIYLEKSFIDQIWHNKGFSYIKAIEKGRNNSQNNVTSSIQNVRRYMTKTNQLKKVKCNEKLYILSSNIIKPKVKKVLMKEVDIDGITLVNDNTFGVYKGDRLLSVNKKMYFQKSKSKNQRKK